MHYFLLGPSGVGKTTFGDWLGANRKYQYLHLAVDRGEKDDGLTAEGLIKLWDQLTQGNPAPLARKLQDLAESKGEKSCALTFPSVTFFPAASIDHLAEHNIAVRYLYGPKESCIENYVRRENRPDRDRAFWCQNNRLYEKMGAPELAPYRVDIIDPSGKRLTESEIAELLEIV
jgi:hypothetical protein